eukprot:gene54760-75034_t
MVGLVEPRPEVWEKIRLAVGLSGAQQPLVLPDAPVAVPPLAGDLTPATEPGNVVAFTPQARRWRNIATGMTAIAAALLTVIAVQAYRPELLPDGLRPKTTQQVAEVKTPPASAAAAPAQYVASLATAVRAVRAGAFDYLVKPFGASRLTTTVTNALSINALSREVATLRRTVEPAEFGGWMGLVLLGSGLVGTIAGGIAADAGLKRGGGRGLLLSARQSRRAPGAVKPAAGHRICGWTGCGRALASSAESGSRHANRPPPEQLPLA